MLPTEKISASIVPYIYVFIQIGRVSTRKGIYSAFIVGVGMEVKGYYG